MITKCVAILIFYISLFSVNAHANSSPVLYFDYDEPSGEEDVVDHVSGNTYSIRHVNNPPERVPGVSGNALRTDGYSTWVHGPLNVAFDRAMTVETWVALESYPSTNEQSLRPSALLHQFNGGKGFEIGIDTYGNWWFTVNVGGALRTINAPERFPLYEWSHIAAVVDDGRVALYLNGEQVAEVVGDSGSIEEASGQEFELGRAPEPQFTGVFHVNGINATYDETRVYASALASDAIEEAATETNLPRWQASLLVPESRFSEDDLRPRFHAMPPANWTNEPHGLVRNGDKYHMFYQRTPNGPYKWMMHWGHMASDDLVRWEHKKDALYPEQNNDGKEGLGSKGIWSGDVVMEDGVAYAYYTTVNFGGPFDPGVGLAVSDSQDLEEWQKIGGIIDKNSPNEGGIADFRDPYLWKDGDTWHMIIGAAMGSSGGVEYYTTQSLGDGIWTRAEQSFSTVPFSDMDTGSVIWEMPVFEYLGDFNGQKKYALVVSPIGGQMSKNNAPFVRSVYWTGTWQVLPNGQGQFTPDYTTPKNLDLIHGHLSPTVARGSDGIIRAIGIVDERSNSELQNELGWAHTFSLPRVWRLLDDGQTIGQRPVDALNSLRVPGSREQMGATQVSGFYKLPKEGKQLEIIAEVNPGTTQGEYGLSVFASPNGENRTLIYYDGEDVVIDKTRSSTLPGLEEMAVFKGDYDESVFGKPSRFHIYLDHSVITVFINDKAVFSNRVYPERSDSTGVYLYSSEAATEFSSVEMYEVESISQLTSVRAEIIQNEEIVEGEEDGSSFDVELSGNLFVDSLDSSQWILSGVPEGVGVGSVERIASTRARVTLSGNASLDYDEDILGGIVEIPASQMMEDIPQESIVASGLTFSAVEEPVTTIIQSAEGDLVEGQLDGLTFTVSLTNNQFKSSLDPSEWQAHNLPEGLDYQLDYIDEKTVQVTLIGEAEDFSEDVVDFGFTVSPSAFVYEDPQLHGEAVEVRSGLIFKAVNGEIVYDFESGSLDGWCVTAGTTFTDQSVTSETDWHSGTFGQTGTYHLWGFNEVGDEATGEAQTGVFELGGDGVIRFQIAGGDDIDQLYLALVSADTGEILHKATGHNSESYRTVEWDVSSYLGDQAYLELVDKATGGWGHINADHIRVPVSDDNAGVVPSSDVNSVTGVSVSTPLSSLVVGAQLQLEATIEPNNTCARALTWSSSHPERATVDMEGNVTALTEGEVTIEVAVDGENVSAEIILTVEPAAPLIRWNFEGGDLAEWNTEGAAFTDAGVTTESCFWMECFPFNREGDYHFWGFLSGGDEATGRMTSPTFVLEGDGIISFLIAGGYQPDLLKVALVHVDSGSALFETTGHDDERFEARVFDASDYIGERFYIEIVDNATGGWGHLNLDDIVVPGRVVSGAPDPGQESVLVFDFEDETLDGWITSGDAFSESHIQATKTYWDGRPFNQQGSFHLWGYGPGGDAATGSMRSEAFVLGGDGVVRFKLGGGNDINNLYVALVDDSTGEELYRVTAFDDEAYQEVEIDAAEHVGRSCHLLVVDNSTAGFGHLNLDDVRIPVVQ